MKIFLLVSLLIFLLFGGDLNLTLENNNSQFIKDTNLSLNETISSEITPNVNESSNNPENSANLFLIILIAIYFISISTIFLIMPNYPERKLQFLFLGLFIFIGGLIFIGYLISGFEKLENWITAGFTIVLVFVTYQYVLLTKDLVNENKKLAEIQQRLTNQQTLPELHIFLKRGEFVPNYIWMVIENYGGGAAKNVTFRSEPDFNTISGSLNEQYDIFSRGMSYFPPHQSIAFLLTDFSIDADKKRDFVFTIIIDYDDDFNTHHTKTIKIELFQFWGQRYIFDNPSRY